MKAHFRAAHERDEQALVQMMLLLYAEDAARGLGIGMDASKALRTIKTLREHPDKGCVLIIEQAQQAIGYSIIINFWSNEYGGNIIDIDELFIKEDYRSKGIGTQFIQHLGATRFNECVAMQLEVNPCNHKARQLYKNVGFETNKNETLVKVCDTSSSA